MRKNRNGVDISLAARNRVDFYAGTSRVSLFTRLKDGRSFVHVKEALCQGRPNQKRVIRFARRQGWGVGKWSGFVTKRSTKYILL